MISSCRDFLCDGRSSRGVADSAISWSYCGGGNGRIEGDFGTGVEMGLLLWL